MVQSSSKTVLIAMHKHALFNTKPLTRPLKEECAFIVQISKP